MNLRHAALLASLASILALAPACGGDDADTSTGTATTGGAGGGVAASTTGSGVTSSTSGSTSGAGGGNPTDGYGTIAGSCGDIDLEDIESSMPQLLENTLDFSKEGAFATTELSAEGQAMAAKGNLGGSSLISELMAFELLHRCDQAKLVKTEAEVVYATEGKKTDLLVEIDGKKVGVSVVRAMSFPEGAPYPADQALGLLTGKLEDILKSSANVAPEDAWEKQVLAVIAQTPDHAKAIVDAYGKLDAATKADTVVVVSVTEGTDQFVYYNK
ncbi:MAG: hypothetical protein FJ095_18550 [Deltaproteobacteria bacterium]|nr:hypothetical protein [Deltaproteobacteria bacterium]